MARTTDELVAGVIEVDEDIVLDPFINLAAAIVTEHCEPPGTLDEARLTEIETWLAAHFYTVRDPRASSEGAGPVNQSFQSRVDLGLATSHYGQTAMILDSTGKLAALNAAMTKGGKRVAKAYWGGEARPWSATYPQPGQP